MPLVLVTRDRYLEELVCRCPGAYVE
jgi:hypothetical protein